MKRQMSKSKPAQKTTAQQSPDVRKSRREKQFSTLEQERKDDASTDSGIDSSDEGELSTNASEGEDSELDIDEPRIAQWAGEDEDKSKSEDHHDEDKGEGSSNLVENPENGADITSLSFGSLLKARRILDQAHLVEESDSDSEDESVEVDGTTEDENDAGQALAQDRPEIKKPGKRPHKHAPIEMSSKRPVTRRRQVVEVKKVNYRDPRFTSAANEGVRQSFQKRYSFLADMHKTELGTLKENLKRAQKMLRSAPRDRREEWEAEVERLERAYKRVESAVNQDRKEAIERQALEQTRKEENDRRKAGKGQWYMKKSAKKELLLKARHDALAESGGRLAVRKAIEKRQKKVNQKEKKRRPSFMDRGPDPNNRGASKRRKVEAQ